MFHITFATYWTLLRIILVPFIAQALMCKDWSLVLWLFVAALLTDFLDGFFARRWNQVTMLGALLDPIADKLLILASFFTFLYGFDLPKLIAYCLWFLIAKEVLILSGAAVLYLGYQIFIKPSHLSRLASVGEMLFVLLFALLQYFGVQSADSILQIFIILVSLVSSILLVRYAMVVYTLSKK